MPPSSLLKRIPRRYYYNIYTKLLEMELYTRSQMIKFAELMVMTPEKAINFEEQLEEWLSSTKPKYSPIELVQPQEQWVEQRFQKVEIAIRDHILHGLVIPIELVKEYSMIIKARTNGLS